MVTLSCRDRRITEGSVSSRKTQSVLYLQELTLWLLRGLAEVLFLVKGSCYRFPDKTWYGPKWVIRQKERRGGIPEISKRQKSKQLGDELDMGVEQKNKQ